MLVSTGLHSPLFAINSIFVRNLLQTLSFDNRSCVYDSGKADNQICDPSDCQCAERCMCDVANFANKGPICLMRFWCHLFPSWLWSILQGNCPDICDGRHALVV